MPSRSSSPWASRPSAREDPGPITRADVERAIQDGVRSLKEGRRAGSPWPDADKEARTGTTSPVVFGLWGPRTALIDSPGDLSCGWNPQGRFPNVLATEKALRVGQNVVEYATGRKPPPDSPSSSEVRPVAPPVVPDDP